MISYNINVLDIGLFLCFYKAADICYKYRD